MPKKSKDFAPYIFAIIVSITAVIQRNLIHQEGVVLRTVINAAALFVLWRWIEFMLTFFDKKWTKWIYVIIGINIYNMLYIGLDYYIIHQITIYSGVKPWTLVRVMFMFGVMATIVIESMNWTKARQNAEIENLQLQAENIEANFKLLKDQVNPDFLYYCLTTLQKMVDTNDPKTEDYILKLANVYRQILKKERNMITLKEELSILKNYLFLMSYGRETALQYEINVSEISMNYNLPVFAMQTLADNCIKYNDFSIDNPLYIMIFQKDTKSITIANNIQQKVVANHANKESLAMRYAHEGIENGVLIETESSTYSTTLKLI